MEIKAREATKKQIEHGKRLGLNLENYSLRVARALITDQLEINSKQEIMRMKLRPGDKVKYRGQIKQLKNRTFIIASIGESGRVNFKGGGYAFAQSLEKLNSHSDTNDAN